VNLSRILGCVGAITLSVVACNDKDVSLINPGAGSGGSTNAGSGGSSGSGGSAGNSNAGSGGNGGSAGETSAGSGGVSGSAGSPGLDPDAGDSGTPPPGPYAELCANYCAARSTWAAATGDAGVNCPGFDAAGCQAACEAEVDGFVSGGCAAVPAAYECHTTANVWVCNADVVSPNNCEAAFGFDGTNFTCGTNCDNTCNPQAGAVNTCFLGQPVCPS
jgi:hypothetical protein